MLTNEFKNKDEQSQTSKIVKVEEFKKGTESTNAILAAAKSAAENVGPRVYKIAGTLGEKLRFFVIGCQGNGQGSQKDVAKLMDQYIADCALILMSEPPTENTLNALPFTANAAYIRVGDQIFYINKVKKECTLLTTITKTILEQFDLGMHCYKLALHQHRMLSSHELKSISALTGHTHSTDQPPAFILFLGDNMYDYGVMSPVDEAFNSCFYDMYADAELAELAKLPCFLILGNHDANRHKKQEFQPWMLKGEVLEMNEVMHSYLPQGALYKDVNAKRSLYKQNILDRDNLPQWNMPYLFYSIYTDDTQIFCLNSNTYAKDYLDFKNNIRNPNKINQAEWLENEFHKAKLAGRKTILALHHPPYTAGKRAFPKDYDTGHYLSKDKQLPDLQKKLGTDTKSYNELLAKIFAAQDINPTMFFAAHDHALAYYNDEEKNFCQVTCGGGGGDLQRRKNFAGQLHTGCYLKNNGFVVITSDRTNPQEYEIEFHSTAGHHLKFNNHTHFPVREESKDKTLENFREIVLAVADEYFLFKKNSEAIKETEHPPVEHKGFFNYLGSIMSSIGHAMFSSEKSLDDVDCVHDILAYFNQPKLQDIDSVVNKFNSLMNKLADKKSDSSFVTLFNKKYLDHKPFENNEWLYRKIIDEQEKILRPA